MTARILISQLKGDGRLDEAALLEFARRRRYEETVAALAELSQSSVEVVRPLMQSLRSEGILVPCRVAGLAWETVSAILDCRYSSGVVADEERSKLKRKFAELTADKADRLLRLWMVRSVAPAPKTR